MLIFNLNREDIPRDKNYRCENGHGHYIFIGGLDCQGDFTEGPLPQGQARHIGYAWQFGAREENFSSRKLFSSGS